MAEYRYRAFTRGGRTVAGTIEAAGPREAAEALKGSGLYPASISEGRSRERLFRRRTPEAELAASTRQLATLVSAGANLSDALQVLSENTTDAGLKKAFPSIRDSVMAGSPLSKALERHDAIFSPLYRGLVSAAEATGSLDTVLPRLADYLEKRARINTEVRAALAYPALMTVVGVAVLTFLFIFVIPKIAGIFEETGARLPFLTTVLIRVTGFVRAWWPLLAALLGASVWAFRRYTASGRGRALKEEALMKLPWVGPVVTGYLAASFARTLGSLLKGGVQMLKALEVTRDAMDSSVFGRVIDAAIRDCTGGSTLAASLKRTAVVPPLLIHMASIGERSGNLDEMLLKTAEGFETEFENGVRRLLNLLEPLLIVAMGLVVGFIVLSILLPIFELNQTIR